PRAVDHRDLVVDDLTQLVAARIAQYDALATRGETRHRAERRATDQNPHQVDGRLGRLARLAVEVQLVAYEDGVGRHRELDRPPFRRAVADARSGTGEPEVVGVEVGRHQTQ